MPLLGFQVRVWLCAVRGMGSGQPDHPGWLLPVLFLLQRGQKGAAVLPAITALYSQGVRVNKTKKHHHQTNKQTKTSKQKKNKARDQRAFVTELLPL